MIDYTQALKNKCKTAGISLYTDKVLNDPKFPTWSGAGNDFAHHYGDGMLAKHVHEVFEYCELIICQHNSTCLLEDRVNPKEILIAAIWHDYGKLWDYQKVDGVWGKHDNHARTIHHISRSAMEWQKFYTTSAYKDFRIEDDVNIDNVTHNILSHHGYREWGSPVSPATREAHILHLSDMLSARLCDCMTNKRI